MPELMEPTHVERPSAYWLVEPDEEAPVWCDVLDVRRYVDQVDGEKVSLGFRGAETCRIRVTPAVALQLGAAVTSAAQWTGDEVVDATIVDDRPRLEYRLLLGAMLSVRPHWMSPDSARSLGRDLIEWLHHNSPVVITLNGQEWTP